MVEESHLPAVNCVSFADRIRTPRTKRQRQRKSLRKSARLSKTREESCPAECCSVMWGNRVTLRTLFFFSNRWQWPLFNMSRLSALFKMVSWEEKYLISKPLVGMMSIIFFKANGGFGVLDIWNILVGGREIFFFCSHWVVGQSVAVWKTACCSPGPPQMFQHNKVTSHIEAKVFMGMCHLFVV